MPVPVIAAAITGGSTLIGGLLSRKKTVTSTQTPTYTPEQTQLQQTLAGRLTSRLNTPANLDPLKVAATSEVNRGFDSAETRLTERLAARGFGKSGKLALGTKGLEIARAGALGDLESKFSGLQLDQENRSIDDAMQFSFGNPSINRTQTDPGNVLGGALGGGAETAALLYALNHFMGGGGGQIQDAPGGFNALATLGPGYGGNP
jgi:hypothetical protein